MPREQLNFQPGETQMTRFEIGSQSASHTVGLTNARDQQQGPGRPC